MIIKILGSGCKKCVTLGENAKAAADVADNGVTRHRAAALAKTHEHAVHTGYAHTLGFTAGNLFAFFDCGRLRRGGNRIRVQYGV